MLFFSIYHLFDIVAPLGTQVLGFLFDSQMSLPAWSLVLTSVSFASELVLPSSSLVSVSIACYVSVQYASCERIKDSCICVLHPRRRISAGRDSSPSHNVREIPPSTGVSYAVAIYPYMAEQEDEFDVVV